MKPLRNDKNSPVSDEEENCMIPKITIHALIAIYLTLIYTTTTNKNNIYNNNNNRFEYYIIIILNIT